MFSVRWYYTESVDGTQLEMGHVTNQTKTRRHPDGMRITVRSNLVKIIN